MIKNVIITLAFFGFVLMGSVSASIIRIPADQPTIQKGINAAADGDTVLVADGVYSGTGNYALDYSGKSITVKSESGAEHCIIDCQQLGRAVYFHHNETRNARLEGFTVRNGYVYASFSHPPSTVPLDLSHDILDDSRDPEPTCTPTPAPYGGGGIACFHSSPTIAGCIFINNMTYGVGGGIGCSEYSGPLILDCVVMGNRSPQGAGIGCLNAYSTLTIAGCTIQENESSNLGGGMSFNRAPAKVFDSVIQRNEADTCGGGIYGGVSGFELYNCTIVDNRVTSTSEYSYGGGMYLSTSDTKIINCVFYNNTCSGPGGALYLTSVNNLSLQNCTITGNSSGISGGAVHAAYSEYSIIDSILWNNIPEEISHISSEVSITYSIVSGGYPGEGNMNADPRFADGPKGLYYLSEIAAGQAFQSPAIDAGSNPASTLSTRKQSGVIFLNELTTRTDQLMDSGQVNLGFHYDISQNPFTPTPVSTTPDISTPTPDIDLTPTPEPSSVHLDLILSKDVFTPGDEFLLTCEFTRTGDCEINEICLVVLLDVGSQYFWYPGWSQEFQCESMSMPEKFSSLQILNFIWPETNSEGGGIYLFAAMLDSFGIIGNWDYVAFGWK